MRLVKYIVIHCSAGFGSVDAIKSYWKNTLKWKQVGYHRFIDEDGTVHKLANIDTVTNGVAGYNANSVHISYKGGVERTNVNKAKDTRTSEQRKAIVSTINEVLDELSKYQDVSKIKILGHRDFSPDKNGNGVIESWERIKECPSYDAIPEYAHIIPNYLKNKKK